MIMTIRSLGLGALVAMASAAVAGPSVTFQPIRVEPVPLDSHTPGRSAEMVLAAEDVEVEIAGPVARISVVQTWRYDGSWFSPGDEAVQELRTGHLSALLDYWITEEGQVHRGIVRDRRSASAEYAANLASRRDPGLAEWIDEGVYRLRLYPVPRGGGTKKQAFTLLTVLPVRPDGWMRLAWELPIYRVERSSWRIRTAPGAALVGVVAGLPLAAADTAGVLSGTMTGLAAGRKRLEILLATDDVQRRKPGRAWRDASDKHYLQVSESIEDLDGPRRERFVAYIGTVGSEPALAALTHQPLAEPDADAGATLPDSWLEALTASARALRLELDDKRPAEALAQLKTAAIVGPGVVLFANPFATAENVRHGWEQAHRDATQRQASVAGVTGAAPAGSPQASGPSPLSGLDFTLPPSVLTPTFKAARERSSNRACFANQKTVAGVIEMYNLDKNTSVMGLLAPPCRHVVRPQASPGPSPAAPPPGVEWSYWRDPRRILDYREAEGLIEPGMPDLSRATPMGTVDEPGTIVRIPPWLWRELKEGGYLQSVPSDPGQGPGTERHYCLTGWGNGITCLAHGEIQPRLGSGVAARDQLVDAGVRDPQLLAEASTVPYGSAGTPGSRSSAYTGWLLVLAAIVAAIGFLRLVFLVLLTPRPAHVAHAGRNSFVGALWWLGFSVPAILLGPLVLLTLGLAAARLGLFLADLAWVGIWAVVRGKEC
jgi:hypothetical protein